MQKYELGFIGVGNMANAILNGILKDISFKNIPIYTFDKDQEKSKSFEPKGVQSLTCAKDIAKSCNYILIATKPQVIEYVLNDIKDYIRPDTTIISIAAGITEKYIRSIINKECSVVTVMPNMPATIGFGSTAISDSCTIKKFQLDFVYSIFKSFGAVEYINEQKLNYIIPLNGSSPAFIYSFAKEFINFATQNQIEYQKALNLFCNSLIGSAKMMVESGLDIDTLIQNVCSPGGTTIEGLGVFKDNNFEKVISDACSACSNRAFELQK